MVKKVKANTCEGLISFTSVETYNPLMQVKVYERLKAGAQPMSIEIQICKESGPDDEWSDFVPFSSGSLTAGPHVPSPLIRMLEETCHKFELTGLSEPYFAFLPKVFYDAFDRDRSEFIVYPHDPERIAHITKTVLRSADIGTADVFKVSGDGACRGPTYVSDHFYEVYQETGATGLLFKDVDLS